MVGLIACGDPGIDGASDPVAPCCANGCSNRPAASGAPGSGGRPPRLPAVNELIRPVLRAAQTSCNWLLASRKVPGSTVRLPVISVFGAVIVIVPATLPEAETVLLGDWIS